MGKIESKSRHRAGTDCGGNIFAAHIERTVKIRFAPIDIDNQLFTGKSSKNTNK